MKINNLPSLRTLVFLFLFVLHFSCSKDIDLLNDYVLSDAQEISNEKLVLDDAYSITANSSVVLDVLKNDMFETQDVKITSTSTPTKGTVKINANNTLTYTSNTDKETVDTFTYTTEIENEDNTVSTETGTVTVNITETSSDNNSGNIPSINKQAVFTAEMAATIKNRIDNGWAHPGGGYPDDEAYIINQKNAFDANPNIGEWDNFNLSNGATNPDAPVPTYGVTDEIHYAAIYAYLYQDTALAQKVIDKLIDYSQDYNLDIAARVSEYNYNIRDTHTGPWMFIAARMTKFLESYSLCEGLTTISQTDRDDLEQWFEDWKDVSVDITDFSLDVAFGNGWDNDAYSTTGYNFVIKSSGSRTNPAFTDINGDNTTGLLVSNAAQQTGINNIRAEHWGYIHAYGLYFNDQFAKDFSFQAYKTWLTFGVFPDGTMTELVRATSGNPSQGIGYNGIALTAIAKAAMTQKIAADNGLAGATSPAKWLDYTTSSGSDDYTNTSNWVGTSTSGGDKNLLKVTKAHLNFMRQFGGQGWSPLRYYAKSSILMDGDTKMTHRPIAAILNIYYNDPELEAGWKNDAAFGYRTGLTATSGADNVGGYKEPNNGAQGALYGLMYWAGL